MYLTCLNLSSAEIISILIEEYTVESFSFDFMYAILLHWYERLGFNF